MRKSAEEMVLAPIQLSFELPTPSGEELETSGVPIDHAFPEEAADELAKLESFNKHLYRPNTYLHKWWARRSGTTFRHILKQLVADPYKRDYYEPGGLEGKVILDPMMGGGTTLHEAIRMGANVIGVDIDPIPVVQAAATLTTSPLAQKKAVFQEFFRKLKDELAPLYTTTCSTCSATAETQFVLYGLRRRCSCKEVLFVDSLVLRQERDHNVYICPTCHEVYAGAAHLCRKEADRPLYEKGAQHCEECDSKFADILDVPFVERYVPLVVVGMCPKHGQFFKSIAGHDLELIAEAEGLAREVRFGDGESLRIPQGPKSNDLHRRGITTYLELFTARQLLYLNTVRRLSLGVATEDRVWLSLLVSTSLEFHSLLCGYKGSDIRRPGAVRHVFSHHAYSFPYSALENNPVFSGNTSGTLNRLFNDRILKAGRWAVEPMERRIIGVRQVKVRIQGEIDGGQRAHDWKSLAEGQRRFMVLQADSSGLEIPSGSIDFVVTDPPYYDNVQYSDLSTFFRVWLRLFLPGEADWHYDPLASAVSEGNVSGKEKYGEVLGKIWETCHRVLKKEYGRLIFTFHHWNHEAWAGLTLSLKRAGFVLSNRYVVFSENPTSVHIKDLKALKHDAILVLRPGGSHGEARTWPKVAQIDTTDSHDFCRDCGTALGYFLASDLSEDEIRTEWGYMLGGNNDGEASI